LEVEDMNTKKYENLSNRLEGEDREMMDMNTDGMSMEEGM
jgi:hypothetical protein